MASETTTPRPTSAQLRAMDDLDGGRTITGSGMWRVVNVMVRHGWAEWQPFPSDDGYNRTQLVLTARGRAVLAAHDAGAFPETAVQS